LNREGAKPAMRYRRGREGICYFFAIFASSRFNLLLSLIPHFVFDSLNMTSAKAFDFAAELEVAADSGIIEHAEAVYDRNGTSGHSYDFIGV